VLDGDDLKPCLPDDYISGQHHLNHQQQLQLQQQLQQQHPLQQQHYRTHSGDIREIDQEMLTMLSVNQDNGECQEVKDTPLHPLSLIHRQPFCNPLQLTKVVSSRSGPHREMAVDCPDTFIARNKTPPRYPPPRPPQVSKTPAIRNLQSAIRNPYRIRKPTHNTNHTNSTSKKKP